MAFNLGELVFKMSADVASLRADMDEAKRTVGAAAQGIESAMNVARAAVVSLGTAFTVDQLAGWIKSSIDAADATSKQAQSAGVTVEALSALQYAASFADVTNEELTASLAKLSKTTREAADGGKEQAAVFRTLGIQTTDASGKLRSADAVMIDIAARFAEMEDGAQKTALAQDLFGRSGASLIPLLNGGADGIRDMTAEAERLGFVLSSESAHQAEQFNDSITLLQKNAQSLSQSVAVELLPELNRITAAMNDAAKESGLLAAAWVGLGGVLAEGLNLNHDELEDINEQIERMQGLLQAQKNMLEGGGIGAWLGVSENETDAAVRERIADTEMRLSGLIAMRDKLLNPPQVQSTGPRFEAPDLAPLILGQQRVVEGYLDIIRESERARESAVRAIEALTEQVALLGASSYSLASEAFAEYQKRQDEQLQRVRDSLLTEEEAIEQAYQKKREIILGTEFAIEEERTALLERAQKERDARTAAAVRSEADKRAAEEQKGMSAQAKLWQSGLEGRLKVTGSILGTLGNLMYSHNKKAFEVGKVAAIGQATIATYTSAVEAYKAMAGIPVVGPALGAAAAAAAVVAGLANVQAIQSQQFGGGGGAAPTYSAGPGGFPTSSTGAISSEGGAVPTGQSAPAGNTIIIQGDLHSNDAERLMRDIKSLINDSDFVLIESTSRQASELRA